jgi:hypothetical protein
MKHHYKQYEIETTARRRSDGWWAGTANIKPAVGSVRGIQIFGELRTETQAEDAAFELAKQHVDMHTPK